MKGLKDHPFFNEIPWDTYDEYEPHVDKKINEYYYE
jgi:hypothetical protein